MANIIKRIYEIQDTGKGLINSITEDNLLLIFNITQNLQGFEDVLVHNPNLTFGHVINTAQLFNLTSDITDFIIDKESSGNYPNQPLAYLGIGKGNLFNESSFAIFDEVMEFRDTRNNKGVSYAGDYEPNFTARSLITKQYLESEINKQKVISAGSYILTDADNNYTIFIDNGATAMTISLGAITIPNFCVGFIQEGTGDVAFVGSGVSLTNPVGLKSKGQGYQTFIERKLATSTYYLLGNTKV